MKYYLSILIVLGMMARLNAQQAPGDTTIYQVAETLPYPLLNTCNPLQHPGWTDDSVRVCAEAQLLQLLSSNMHYPEKARQNNTTGTVVASFVVEKDGHMSNFSLLKDIGDGCGEEALRVLQAFGEAGLRWRPATREGKAVRMQKVLPLRFRLEEALPYVINDTGDTVYTSLDTDVNFPGGLDSLAKFVANKLVYPQKMRDSCRTGIIEMALLIRTDGSVRVENQLDYSNLGMDFQFQAIRLANQTSGLWQAATYQGKTVNTTFPLRVMFKSPNAACAVKNDRFEQALILADQGAELSDKGDQNGAIAKLSEALELHPGNTELLYYRGTAYFALNKREEGCQDFNTVKNLIGVTWFESIRKVLCGQ